MLVYLANICCQKVPCALCPGVVGWKCFSHGPLTTAAVLDCRSRLKQKCFTKSHGNDIMRGSARYDPSPRDFPLSRSRPLPRDLRESPRELRYASGLSIPRHQSLETIRTCLGTHARFGPPITQGQIFCATVPSTKSAIAHASGKGFTQV
jgi:hypothetical protein